MSERRLTTLLSAVVDGDDIDWPTARHGLSSTRDRERLTQLEALAQLTGGGPRPTAPLRRLPLLLELLRPVAVVSASVGAAGASLTVVTTGDGYVAILLAITITFLGAGVCLDLWGRDRRARSLAACYLTIAAAFSMRGLAWFAPYVQDDAWWRAFTAIRPESFFAACLWQFAREFPRKTSFTRLDTLCVAGWRIAAVLGVWLFICNLVPQLPFPDAFVRVSTLFQRASEADPLFWGLAFLPALAALAVIAGSARRASPDERARVRILLFGIALAIGPVVLEVFAEGLSPSYAQLVRSPLGRWIGGWVIYPPMLALPLITAYAVVVDSVLDVTVVVQQGLRYVLAKWLIMWGASLPLAVLVGYMYWHRHEPLTVIFAGPLIRILVGVAALGSLVLMTRRWLLGLLDRWALPDAESPSAMLAQMAKRMTQARTPLEVATVLARAIERTMQAPTEAWLARGQRLVPIHDAASGSSHASLVGILLEGCREPCVVTPQRRQSYYTLLNEHDRGWIGERGICVLVPVLPSTGALVAVVTLRQRRNALAFSQDDMRFLKAAAGSASLAIDALHATAPDVSSPSGPDTHEFAVQCRLCGQVRSSSEIERPCACGGTWDRAHVPKLIADHLDVTHRLGAGGMGVVYGATDLRLQRDVAIKTIPRLSPAAAERLIVEARAMVRVAHPNIAVLYNTHLWRSTPLLVMERLARGTLANRLRSGPLGEREALDTMLPLVSALDHIHRAGLYHGDVKPTNIGYSVEGIPKLLDFGLCHAISQIRDDAAGEPGRDRPIAGTYAYLSPEVRSGEPAGPALDLWAVSLVVCECLAGPHSVVDRLTSQAPAAAIAAILDEVRAHAGPRTCAFLATALNLDPRHRAPEDASAYITALTRLP